MKRYVFYIVVGLSTFAIGVLTAFAWPAQFGRFGSFVPALSAFASGAVCFGQAFSAKRGLRRYPLYNLLMLSLSGLMFTVAAVLLVIASIILSDSFR